MTRRTASLWIGVIATLPVGWYAFVPPTQSSLRTGLTFPRTTETVLSATASAEDTELAVQKKRLLGLIKPEPALDPVLADPLSKEPLLVQVQVTGGGTLLGGQLRSSKLKYSLQAASPNSTVYEGDSYSYIDLLEPARTNEIGNQQEATTAASSSRPPVDVFRRLTPLVPPPLRAAMSSSGLFGDDYVPMRDLFTSPAVSYAYERGWRQGFSAAGFPGPDEEARLAMDYFAPALKSEPNPVLVDMSCATGLFTRRFAKSGLYRRVMGCDYSDSMLTEARRRIQNDPDFTSSKRKPTDTQVDLVRLDVGQIPMQNSSVDVLHAGAAMHCWPDLPAAVQEIHRVLKPGGRYFATTFLSSYFRTLQAMPGGPSDGAAAPSTQAFQYFGSVDVLRDLLVKDGGFSADKVFIEVLGNACVVIRAEK